MKIVIMKKQIIFLSAGLFLALGQTLKAQDIDPQIHRWLLQHPTSAERGDVLLQLENDQIAIDGKYNITPFRAPQLYQLRPSQEYLQYFFDGQNELEKAFDTNLGNNGLTKDQIKALRKRYTTLYSQGDPTYKHEAEYYLGYLDYAEGKYSSALKHFDALPLEDKYMETVPFYRMQILYAQGKFAEAVREADIYTPNEELFQIEALRVKAECQLQSGKLNEALSSFRQYLKRTGKPVPSSAYNAGVLEFQNGFYNNAIADGGLATQTDAPQLKQQAYMLIGQSSLQQAENQKARMAFEQAAAIGNGDNSIQVAAAYNVCAIAHNASSVWGDEVKVLESFLNTYPTSQYADRVSQYLVEVYSTTRNYGQALQSIAKINKPNATILKAKQKLHYQWGVQNYLNALYGDAAKQFDQSIRLGSLEPVCYAESYFWRGEARYHLSNFKGAVSDYQMFNRLNQPGVQSGLFAASLYNCGYALMKQEDYNSAIDAFTHYIAQPTEENTETYIDGMLRLADCYYYTRQFALGESYYHNAALSESKQKDYALYQEGLMLGLQKKFNEKQAKLDEMLTACPESSLLDDAWLDKGRTSLLQNDAPAAIHSFQQVIDNYPESPIAPQAAVELAMTYNNLGQADAAQKIYQMVAERWPNSEEAQTAAEDLKNLEVLSRIQSLPALYEAGEYRQLLDTYQQLQSENVDFRDAQTMKVLAAKAHLKLGETQTGVNLLHEAAEEVRTASGSEAKYLLAQAAYDGNDIEAATALDNELIQSGTPHMYWLARGIILMSDILRRQGETFTADEYLKSLQQNYTTQDDIQTLIQQRLSVETEEK